MRIPASSCTWAALTFASLCQCFGTSFAASLPVVDLGYELHEALSFNATSEVYKFSNIRYAQPPVGNLRFRAPLAPLSDRSTIQNGSGTRICPQGVPEWQASAFIPVALYEAGKPFTLEAWEASIANSSPIPGLDFNANAMEDCLFLDVHVSLNAFNNASKVARAGEGAPVLVWIHGGGYVFGSKIGFLTPGSNPDGLFKQAAEMSDEGIVFVAINYRLGALGFLSSPEVQQDGALNAGLLDQRLALEWVQTNIHLFGGSPEKVTVIGESAGGGAALLHLTSYGGEAGSTPFSQVIVQSPAFPPTYVDADTTYGNFLALSNVSSLSEARELTSEQVMEANAQQISAGPQTTYTYGPVVDGLIVPGPPHQLFQDGKFDTTVKVLASHNSFEGSFFFDPDVQTDDQFRSWIGISVPGMSDSAVDYLADVLYPPVFDGSMGYVDQESRQMALWAESYMECNFLLINGALNGSSYSYEFSVTPGLHGQDLTYTFNDYKTPARYPEAQSALQQIISSFMITGVPTVQSQSYNGALPLWGVGGDLVNITEAGVQQTKNDVNETRCAWWQQDQFSS